MRQPHSVERVQSVIEGRSLSLWHVGNLHAGVLSEPQGHKNQKALQLIADPTTDRDLSLSKGVA